MVAKKADHLKRKRKRKKVNTNGWNIKSQNRRKYNT